MPSLPPDRSSRTPSSLSTSSFWVGLGLAGTAIALAVLGFSLESKPQNELPPGARLGFVTAVDNPPVVVSRVVDANTLPFVEVSQHEGRQVYRIRVKDSGDEIIVDYTTGKLIAVREISPQWFGPPPMVESIVTSS